MNIFFNIGKKFEAKYFVESVTAGPPSGINALNDYGNIKDPFDLVLTKKSFFGKTSTVNKRVFLPRGFNIKQLKKGRQIVL
jgi:hypothetical protein